MIIWLVSRLICRIKGHKWEFDHNNGVPLGCSQELYEKLKAEGKVYAVNQCLRCGLYDHPDDGLDPYRRY